MRTPARIASRTSSRAEVDPVGQAVRLDRRAVRGARREDRLEVDGVRRAVVEDAALRMADRLAPRDARRPRACACVSCSRDCRWPACTDACTQSSSARTSSGRSSVPSARMSHSLPRRTRNGASCSFAAAISSPWRRRSSASSPGTTRTFACGRRSRCTRSRARAPPRPSRAPTPCRPTTSCARAGRRGSRTSSTSAGGAPSYGASRSSGGRYGTAERAKSAVLVGRVRQRAERRDVARCRSRARARCRSGRAARRPSSTGTPSTVTPSARARSRSTTRDDLGQRREAVEHVRRARRRHDDGERSRQVAPAPRVAGRDRRRAPSAIPSASASARFRISPRRGVGRGSVERGAAIFASVAGPMPGTLAEPSGRRRLAQLGRSADAERPAELDHALRRRGRPAARARRAPAAPRPRARRSPRPPGLDELAQPRLDRRPDRRAARAPVPCRTSSATGAGVARISSAARRYARTL